MLAGAWGRPRHAELVLDAVMNRFTAAMQAPGGTEAQRALAALQATLTRAEPTGVLRTVLAAKTDDTDSQARIVDWPSSLPRTRFTWRGYAGKVTPEKLADLARLRRARDLMDREYASPLDVAALARAALMSTAHFSRQFRAAYGETPYAYLMTRRIERAKALLRQDDLSVTEVCLAVGCTSLGSFSARFTQVVGETPTAYRARDHGALVSVPGCIAKELTRPAGVPSRIGEARAALAR
jgi:AraC-like DNA-binding protein